MNTSIKRGIIETVRKYLKNYLPFAIVDSIIVHPEEGTLWLKDKPFGVFKFFEQINEPLFRFVNPAWMTQNIVHRDGRKPQPAFKLYLSPMGLPSLCFPSQSWPQGLIPTIERLMEEGISIDAAVMEFPPVASAHHPGYEIWEPKYAMEWLDLVNQHYVPPSMPESLETRRYPAAWEGRQLSWTHGEDIYVSQVGKSQEGRIQGMVDVQDNTPVKFFFLEGGHHEFNLFYKEAYRGEKVEKD